MSANRKPNLSQLLEELNEENNILKEMTIDYRKRNEVLQDANDKLHRENQYLKGKMTVVTADVREINVRLCNFLMENP